MVAIEYDLTSGVYAINVYYLLITAVVLHFGWQCAVAEIQRRRKLAEEQKIWSFLEKFATSLVPGVSAISKLVNHFYQNRLVEERIKRMETVLRSMSQELQQRNERITTLEHRIAQMAKQMAKQTVPSADASKSDRNPIEALDPAAGVEQCQHNYVNVDDHNCK